MGVQGYGSLAESTAAYDDFTEDGEDQQSKMSSPWASTNLIARMPRHGSSSASNVHRYVCVCMCVYVLLPYSVLMPTWVCRMTPVLIRCCCHNGGVCELNVILTDIG